MVVPEGTGASRAIQVSQSVLKVGAVGLCLFVLLALVLGYATVSRSVDLSRLKILVGGSALPEGLAQEAMDRGIHIMAAYGMSETCLVVTAAHLQPDMADLEPAARRSVLIWAGFFLPLPWLCLQHQHG